MGNVINHLLCCPNICKTLIFEVKSVISKFRVKAKLNFYLDAVTSLSPKHCLTVCNMGNNSTPDFITFYCYKLNIMNHDFYAFHFLMYF